eukprot:5281086-Pleurochrysis_carterae.AAC.1
MAWTLRVNGVRLSHMQTKARLGWSDSGINRHGKQGQLQYSMLRAPRAVLGVPERRSRCSGRRLGERRVAFGTLRPARQRGRRARKGWRRGAGQATVARVGDVEDGHSNKKDGGIVAKGAAARTAVHIAARIAARFVARMTAAEKGVYVQAETGVYVQAETGVYVQAGFRRSDCTWPHALTTQNAQTEECNNEALCLPKRDEREGKEDTELLAEPRTPDREAVTQLRKQNSYPRHGAAEAGTPELDGGRHVVVAARAAAAHGAGVGEAAHGAGVVGEAAGAEAAEAVRSFRGMRGQPVLLPAKAEASVLVLVFSRVRACA